MAAVPAYPEVVKPAPLVEAALLTASGLVAAVLAHLAELTLTRQVALKHPSWFVFCGVASACCSEQPTAMLKAAAEWFPREPEIVAAALSDLPETAAAGLPDLPDTVAAGLSTNQCTVLSLHVS